MIRVTGREFNGVQASPCFRGGEFSCISCHEMHLDSPGHADVTTWARTGQLKPKMESDAACLQCHKDMSARLVAHTHHPADSSGSRCYNCHMPNTTFGLLHAMRSHQVSSPTVHESIAYGRSERLQSLPSRPDPCLDCQKLHAWYNQPMPDLSQDDQTIAAAVQWLVKGDAGQRVAHGLGLWAGNPRKKSRAATGFIRTHLHPRPILTPRSVSTRGNRCKRCPVSRIFLLTTAADGLAQRSCDDAYEKWLRERALPERKFIGLRRCSTRMDVYNKIFSNGSESRATISGSSWRNDAAPARTQTTQMNS